VPSPLQAMPPSLPRRVALTALVPLPALKTQCGRGYGLAASPALGLLVTSDTDKNSLSVWALPSGGSSGRVTFDGAGAGAGASASGGGLTPVCTLGGDGSAAPMQFKFIDGVFTSSGYLAFTPLSSISGGLGSLLLVTDAGHNAVHLVDVVRRTHAGYLAPPGSIAGPRGVASNGPEASPLVAVSAWKEEGGGEHVVRVYRGSGRAWEVAQVIGVGFSAPGNRDGQLKKPLGLRFSQDCSAIYVADCGNRRVSFFRVVDGGFVRHIAKGLSFPLDVEEVHGGALVACYDSHCVMFVGDGAATCHRLLRLGKAGGGKGSGDGAFKGPTALAVVRDLGLVVREYRNGRLQVFG
jgi:hypothetical protein